MEILLNYAFPVFCLVKMVRISCINKYVPPSFMQIEMMSESIDETLDKDEAEEETEELTNQVLDEIGVDIASQVCFSLRLIISNEVFLYIMFSHYKLIM